MGKMASTDVLDVLPDDVLPYILSYLPTKQAVRAQLISKRWKNLWAYVPVLDFNFADFLSEDIFTHLEDGIGLNDDSECHENFVKIVDDVLALRKIRQIDRFKLVWQYQIKFYYDESHPVRKWILHVLDQSPQVLSIHVAPNFSPIKLPDTIFTCSTLKEMKLKIDCIWLELLTAELVILPCLRKLNLGFYTITADFMNKLLLGCPNLEELELFACRLHLSEFSCSSLKSLVINGSCNSADIWISIPTLQYLKVTVMSCQAAKIVFENMSSLVKACVCFLTADTLERSFYNSEANILKDLSGVTNLEVVLHGPEAKGMLKHALKDCPAFKNLKAVHFESFDGCLVGCVNMIDRLAQHSAVLKHLSFYRCELLIFGRKIAKKIFFKAVYTRFAAQITLVAWIYHVSTFVLSL